MAQIEGKVAKRYARALFEYCDPKHLEEIRDALKALSVLVEDHNELRFTLLNPGIPMHERLAVVRDLASSINTRPEFANFAGLVLSNGRIAGLAEICEEFARRIEALRKILRLEVASAFELAEDEKGRIQQAAEKACGSLATIAWSVDTELLGGMRVRNGDRLLDSSIRGSLERARAALLA